MAKVGRVDGDRPWAPIVGYSRAVRMGNLIEVSGTTATTRDGGVICPNDPYGQMQYILAEVKKAIEELGATFENTIRTRVFMTNIDDWPAGGQQLPRLMEKYSHLYCLHAHLLEEAVSCSRNFVVNLKQLFGLINARSKRWP